MHIVLSQVECRVLTHSLTSPMCTLVMTLNWKPSIMIFGLISAWADYELGYGSLDSRGAWRRWSLNENHVAHSPSYHRGKRAWITLSSLVEGTGSRSWHIWVTGHAVCHSTTDWLETGHVNWKTCGLEPL